MLQFLAEGYLVEQVRRLYAISDELPLWVLLYFSLAQFSNTTLFRIVNDRIRKVVKNDNVHIVSEISITVNTLDFNAEHSFVDRT